tara:strand:- start:351 stop:974 length:624 start_codon:yes stop_codon:yes gene_type:complete
MNVIYYVGNPGIQHDTLNKQQLQNIEKNIDILDERIHVYLTKLTIFNMMDTFFKNIHHKLSDRCKGDLELFTLLKHRGSLVMDCNISFKKNIFELIDKNTTILLLYEDHILKCKRKILGCFCWSHVNHAFWNDCLVLLRKRIIKLLCTKNDKSNFDELDEHWLSANDIMTDIWSNNYRYDTSFKLLDYNVYKHYLECTHYLDFKVWF